MEVAPGSNAGLQVASHSVSPSCGTPGQCTDSAAKANWDPHLGVIAVSPAGQSGDRIASQFVIQSKETNEVDPGV